MAQPITTGPPWDCGSWHTSPWFGVLGKSGGQWMFIRESDIQSYTVNEDGTVEIFTKHGSYLTHRDHTGDWFLPLPAPPKP